MPSAQPQDFGDREGAAELVVATAGFVTGQSLDVDGGFTA